MTRYRHIIIPAACALLVAGPALAGQGGESPSQRQSNIERTGAQQAGETRDYGDKRQSEMRRTGDRNQDRQQDRQRSARQENARQDQDMRMGQRQAGTQQASDYAGMEYQQVRGTVQDVRRVNLRGQDAQTYLVLLETEQGNRFVIDVGEGIKGLSVNQGQEFSARGRPVQVSPGKVVLMASSIFTDERAYDVNRPAMRQRSAMR